MWTSLFTSVFLATSVTVSYATGNGDLPSVKLGVTDILGTLRGSNNVPVEFYGGLPFAEPPVGNRRFARPTLKLSLAPLASFNATNFGPACMQLDWPGNMSEDCLTINVFKPSRKISSPASPIPVMVYFYGGGYSQGDSSLYNGVPLVAQSMRRGTPVLFVSINYRLSVYGFPIGSEAAQRGSLNLALYDQKTALEWIHSNIHNFGGDPEKVTVFGQSAGAMSVSFHYVNDYFPKLARAAIFQSGLASSLPTFHPDRDSASWELFVQNVPSCATAAPNNTFSCLMTASANEILAGSRAGFALNPYPFRPVIDGQGGMVSDYPEKRLARGAGGLVPFVAGTVLDEGTYFVPQQIKTELIPLFLNANYTPSPLGADALSAAVDKIISAYPDDPSAGSPYNTGNQTFGTGTGYKKAASIVGDLNFQAQRRNYGLTAAAQSYGYIFTDLRPDAYPPLGVNHSAELCNIFGSYLYSTVVHQNLSLAMLDYWLSFAVSLTPNDGKGSNRSIWEVYGHVETKRVLELNSNGPKMIQDDYRASAIETITSFNETLSW